MSKESGLSVWLPTIEETTDFWYMPNTIPYGPRPALHDALLAPWETLSTNEGMRGGAFESYASNYFEPIFKDIAYRLPQDLFKTEKEE